MKNCTLLAFLALFTWSCIGDDVLEDFVQPELRITNQIDSLTIDSSYRFSVLYFNNIGAQTTITPGWSSSDEAILTIDADGLATARAFGPVEVTASFDDGTVLTTAMTSLHTAENPIIPVEPELQTRQGTIRTTSSYVLTGGFVVEERAEGGILLKINEDYRASTALPDLFLYLSNNPASIADALVVADVEIFSGAHEYLLPDVGIDDYRYLLYYCRPFNVKVGDGELRE